MSGKVESVEVSAIASLIVSSALRNNERTTGVDGLFTTESTTATPIYNLGNAVKISGEMVSFIANYPITNPSLNGFK